MHSLPQASVINQARHLRPLPGKGRWSTHKPRSCDSGNPVCTVEVVRALWRSRVYLIPRARSPSCSGQDWAVMFHISGCSQPPGSSEELCPRLWTSQHGHQFVPLYHKIETPLRNIPSKISTSETIFSHLVESELADLKFTSVGMVHVAVLWGWLLIQASSEASVLSGFFAGSSA